MDRRMLINARDLEECRIAIIEDNQLVELEIESDFRTEVKREYLQGANLAHRTQPSSCLYRHRHRTKRVPANHDIHRRISLRVTPLSIYRRIALTFRMYYKRGKS